MRAAKGTEKVTGLSDLLVAIEVAMCWVDLWVDFVCYQNQR